MKISDIDLVEDAWLGLKKSDLQMLKDAPNPLMDSRRDSDRDTPGLFELRLMRDPSYLFYAAKVLLDVQLIPEQGIILEEIWRRPFPMYIASRGFGKSYLLALYAVLKCALVPGSKIVIVGAAFRQSKVIFEYMETLWRQGSVLRSVYNGNRDGPRRDVDRCTMNIGSSWAIAVPLGNGDKIRGLRAHTIILDEFGSVPPDIYETVVQGFVAVSATPQQNVKDYARMNALKKKGDWNPLEEAKFQAFKQSNKIVLSGTADYDFKHFADYFKKYRGMIRSQGNPEAYSQWLDSEEDALSSQFGWTDFSIIRYPYLAIPKGFMDDKVIARAKATMDRGNYLREYGACFPKDSTGFFKRTLIEGCVAGEKTPVKLPSGLVWFDAAIQGNPKCSYIYGVDPGAEIDNFAIIILELHSDHTRVVYSWTTNKKDFRKRVRLGQVRAGDYYSFVIRKIRDLMVVFPPLRIGMDAQGGGNLIMEGLHDLDKIAEGEHPLWEVIDPDKPKDTDLEQGLHILEMIQFAKYDWVYEANHGLRKDMEDRVLLFPRFDPISLELANSADSIQVDTYQRKNPGETLILYDRLEDCVMEIEELKNELTSITAQMTGTGVQGRLRWDTPESKTHEGKKIRLRNDRYSALVIANMLARQAHRTSPPSSFEVIGGFSKDLANADKSGSMYRGPAWYTEGYSFLKDITSINRNK